jgi:hydroxypyruvate reductase
MAVAVEEVLEERITAGLVNVKSDHILPTRTIQLNEAGHPIPDVNGARGSGQILELLQRAGERDLVICLISGGGSALMIRPVEGISLDDMQRLTDTLLRSGADINEINRVRKHIEALKGGQLARYAYPAQVISLILSDVVGNPLDSIASGPSVPDSSTFPQAHAVVAGRGLWDEIPASITQRLQAGKDGDIPDTPKAGDPIFQRTHNLIVGSNEVAARAAVGKAQKLGFNTLFLSTYIEGEAREVAKVFAGIAKGIYHEGEPLARPACVVAGGETTVTVRGPGLGGRNQELALAASLEIAGLKEVMVVAAATDGTDGPTNAGGAIADGNTISRARDLGLEARDYLAQNDSYHFFQALGDLLITGPTNTNVNDLTFIYVF